MPELYAVKLRALIPVMTDVWYGLERKSEKVEAGQLFVTDSRTAERLESAGIAERPTPVLPTVTPQTDASLAECLRALRAKSAAPPENKMITVSEDKAEKPARKRGRPRKLVEA
jgi:hypothetical protein